MISTIHTDMICGSTSSVLFKISCNKAIVVIVIAAVDSWGGLAG